MTRIRFIAPLLLLAVACHKKSPSADEAATPGNDVLITKEQVSKMKVEVQSVEVRDVDDTVVTTGKVAFDDQKIVHEFSPVTGKAVRVIAQLGDHVKRGDPLAVIESPDVGVATSDVGKANADLIAAEHDYRRQKELLETHATAQKDVETAADNYRKAKAELERAQQKAALFHQGSATGQSYTMTADLDGEVFMKNISPGMEVAGQYGGSNPVELFTIGQADRVWVFADLFELDVARVKMGAKVVVNVASYPGRNFEGKVDWIAGALDKDTHSTKLRCTFDNADGALKPEMFATVKISVDQKKSLAIPRSSVLRFGDQTVVFLDRGPKDGKEHFERVPVTVDEGEGSEWLTVDPNRGIVAGDKIVTAGAIMLSGML